MLSRGSRNHEASDSDFVKGKRLDWARCANVSWTRPDALDVTVSIWEKHADIIFVRLHGVKTSWLS